MILGGVTLDSNWSHTGVTVVSLESHLSLSGVRLKSHRRLNGVLLESHWSSILLQSMESLCNMNAQKGEVSTKLWVWPLTSERYQSSQQKIEAGEIFSCLGSSPTGDRDYSSQRKTKVIKRILMSGGGVKFQIIKKKVFQLQQCQVQVILFSVIIFSTVIQGSLMLQPMI